jgi:spore coat polysaccharide biosynthesis predicted glycosyltransferase SpsG
MKIVYEVIFGESWGGGHLARALKMQSNATDKIDIFVNFEKPDDSSCIPFSKKIIPEFYEDQYDLHIVDTLGKFVHNFAANERIYLDAIELHSDNRLNHQHLLYPYHTSTEFRYSSLLKPRPMKNVAIIQGSSDDHDQIIEISKKIPSNLYQVIFTTTNCRHLSELKRYSKQSDNIDLLINTNFTQYLTMFSTIITAGGNTLIEVLESGVELDVIVYSKEEKEHVTVKNYLLHPKIVKYHDVNENFSWDH